MREGLEVEGLSKKGNGLMDKSVVIAGGRGFKGGGMSKKGKGLMDMTTVW